MKKLLIISLFLILFIGFAIAESETLRTEIEIDWIDKNRFDILEDDPDIKIEVLNRSNNVKVDSRIDIEHINDSNYDDFSRIIRIDFDAEKTFSCSSAQIDNISCAVDKLVNHCQNYQNYLNGTLNNLGTAIEWQAEAARLKEELRHVNNEKDTYESSLNTTQQQLTGCKTDKENYYQDWKSADTDYATCSEDLKDAKDSFAGKYLIGAILGGVAIYLFTKKESGVAQESEEFEEVEY